jgi:glutathione synthase/RimK-type ligase-like ATP-grasp enzyme
LVARPQERQWKGKITVALFIVVDNPEQWAFDISGVEIVSAKEFLMEQKYENQNNLKVFNLCESYKYQTLGYYVSLIAAARGYKAVPNVASIEEMKSQAVVKIITDDIEELIQESLADLTDDIFVLSVYFGRNLEPVYDRLSMRLFNMFQAPLLRAHFIRKEQVWELRTVSPIPASEVPGLHKEFVEAFASQYFSRRNFSAPKRNRYSYDLAILVNKEEDDPPSNEKALEKFEDAAEKLGFRVDFIDKDDYNKLGEYDALFIRETTRVNHHTFRFSQRAAAEGLVVIDDPLSILRCSNKVYLAERMRHDNISVPKTLVLHPDNAEDVLNELGFPCVLKQPDSAFSRGVVKVNNKEEYFSHLKGLFANSDLIVAQEFLPTNFDWRVSILDGEPLFACKYFMAPQHWQIYNWDKRDKGNTGKVETLMPEMCSRKVLSTALKAARLIGNGFYGVDLKQVENKVFVIEINDNPNVDNGIEDLVLKDKLYKNIMEVFLRRLQAQRVSNLSR